MSRLPHFLRVASALALVAALGAQSYSDLTLVRNRKNEGENLLQVRAGVGFGRPSGSEDESIGLQSVVAPDGHIYFRRRGFGSQNAVLLAYAGFDGLYATVKDDPQSGRDGQNRMEVFGRVFPFYREGFYRNGDFVPTGRYEGSDYGVALAASRMMDRELRVELGVFYKRYLFSENETTAANYVVPEDFNGYGGKLTLEHHTLTTERTTGRPNGGFLFTVGAEREQNDSKGTFGTVGIYESELPGGLWRGRGHLEWYFPHTEVSTFAFVVDGSFSDDQDRIYNNDASKPMGSLWFDGQLRWRLDVGSAFSVTPFLAGQYLRVLDESGFASDVELFFGGGLDLRLDLGTNFTAYANYSYLNNESRATVSPTRDTLGEHQLFAGMEIRF